MGTSRVRRPETVVIPISNGDTITVKKHLTSGESRAMARMQYVPNPLTGEHMSANPIDIGMAHVLAYLLDWTIADDHDQPIVIYRQGVDVVRSALDAIDPECYVEILRTIEAHDDRMRAERAALKNGQGGETIPSSSSVSPSEPA
jgi:hypothetical protein